MTIWLNLGCSDDIRDEFINVDKSYPGEIGDEPPNFLRWDLSKPWPWANDSIDYVLARDIIEHLPDKIHTMNEIYRVLKPGGIADVEVPTTDGPGAFQDPTHISYWNRNSFKYFEHGNVYRDRFADSYGTNAAFRIRHWAIENSDDGPRLIIQLEAVK